MTIDTAADPTTEAQIETETDTEVVAEGEITNTFSATGRRSERRRK
jgi:hypothetical protein